MSVVGIILLHKPYILSSVKVFARVFSLSLLLAGADVGDGLESVICEHVSHLGIVGKVKDSEKRIYIGSRITEGDAGEFV
jgi:hypothetical protein